VPSSQQWSLASHYHERLYTLGVDEDIRRKGMYKGRGEENDFRGGIFPIRDTQALSVFNRDFRVSVCLSFVLY